MTLHSSTQYMCMWGYTYDAMNTTCVPTDDNLYINIYIIYIIYLNHHIYNIHNLPIHVYVRIYLRRNAHYVCTHRWVVSYIRRFIHNAIRNMCVCEYIRTMSCRLCMYPQVCSGIHHTFFYTRLSIRMTFCIYNFLQVLSACTTFHKFDFL